MENVAGIHAVLADNGIIAEEPQHDTQHNEREGALFLFGELPRGGVALGGGLLNAVLNALLLHLRAPLGLTDGEKEDNQRGQHQRRYHAEIAHVAHHGVFHGGGGEHHAKTQHQDAAHGAHEVNNGVCLGAERLQGHIGHQRHGGRTEHRHREKHKQQQRHKHNKGGGILGRHIGNVGLACRHNEVGIVAVGDLCAVHRYLGGNGGELGAAELLTQHEFLAAGCHEPGILLGIVDDLKTCHAVHLGHGINVLELCVIGKAEEHQQNSGAQRTHHNKGGAATRAVTALIRQRAEQGQ